MCEGERKCLIHKPAKIFSYISPCGIQFQFVPLCCVRKSSRSARIAVFPSIDHFLPGTWSSSEYSAGPKVSPFLREKSALVPGSRWRVDNWPIVARPPWIGVCIRRFARGGQEGTGGESRERVYRQGSPDPLASGPAKARGLIYEWDQTPEVVDWC